MSAIADGDRAAFATLLNRHLDPVHGYLFRMTGSRSDAEDLAQETFFRVWRKASTYRPGRVKASTWIHTIAHNLCVDLFRRHREGASDQVPDSIDETTDPARLASAEAENRLLEAAIANLSGNQRSALLLCQVHGYSNAEAANILGVGTRALESLLARAKRSLKKELLANGNMTEGETR
jgi:RNA polymerase sigma-70 factor (ECF subfamily)